MAPCRAMICHRVTLSGDAEWPKVADAVIEASFFQCRYMPSLHPYAAVERSPTAMSLLLQPSHWSLGQLPLPTRMQTLLVQRLQAHLQRSDRYPAPSEQAVAATLDSGNFSALSRLFVSADREGSGGAYPYQLSLVLVAAECRAVL